jgi:hypothetical protein
MKIISHSASMSFRALRLRSGQAPRGTPMMQIHTRTIIGIPRRKTPRNDTIVDKMITHLTQTQSNIVCVVNFPHKLKETLYI